MNRHLLLGVLVSCLVGIWRAMAPVTVAESPRLLLLQVWRVDAQGGKQPARGAAVSLVTHGNPIRVDARGQAWLPLPPTFEPGDPLWLHVSLDGHQFVHPCQGQLVMPRHLESEVVEVLLLPTGSTPLLLQPLSLATASEEHGHALR